MRIGVDATSWANGRGYGRFAREIIRAMAELSPEHEYVCFGDDRAIAAFDHPPRNVIPRRVALAESPTLAASSDGNRSPADMLRLTRAVARERLDVFFSPTVYTYFPLPPRLRAVVTVHDTIAERFPELTLPSARARLFWKLKVGLAIRQANLVLTVSHYSARSIADVFHLSRDRIRVAVEAPASAYFPSSAQETLAAAGRAGLPVAPTTRWFVYVGGFNPHKRLDVIVRAHARVVKSADCPPYLLLVGTLQGDVFHGEAGRIRALIDELGTGEWVKWTGFLPDEELRQLHGGATAAVLVSECEGFGLPAVEAAACGAPVIATTESPLPELLSGGGIFVRPGDEDALVSAMQQLLCDQGYRDHLGARARERASALTWRAGAQAALDAILEAAA
ncbi:MAG: glycosyltransferase family 1 protein [Gemmatimonadaceae bacterium]